MWGGTHPQTHRQVIDTRAPRPFRCVWIFNPLLRHRVRWDYPPVNLRPAGPGIGPVWFGAPRFGDSGVPPVARGCGGGRQVLAAGGNRVAGEFRGVNTRRITFTVMLVMLVVAAIAGMLYAGRLESGRDQWGTGYELSVFVAVILGLMIIVAVALARKK